MAGNKGDKAREVLESFNEVIMKVVNIIMYYAPIGFMCCTASLVGTFGSAIAVGYIKTFVIYTVVCLLFYFIMYTIYAFIAGRLEGVKRFWKNVIPASLTSIATCSSAASIPVNSECAKKIGVPDDIAETVIPLGTSFHKDGSIIGSVFKIMFLVCLFGTNISGFDGIFKNTTYCFSGYFTCYCRPYRRWYYIGDDDSYYDGIWYWSSSDTYYYCYDNRCSSHYP